MAKAAYSRKQRLKTSLTMLSLAALFLVAFPCLAVPHDKAEQANEKGKLLFEENKFAEAAEIWRSAFYDAKGPIKCTLAYNVGGIYMHVLDRPSEAFAFLSFVQSHTVDQEMRQTAGQMLDELRQALSPGRGLVTVTAYPLDSVTYLNKESPETRLPSSFTTYLSPGVHRIIVKHPEWPSKIKEIVVIPGGDKRVSIVLQKKTVPPPPPRGNDETPENRAWPWLLLGTGVAMAGTGGALELVAMSRADSLPDKYEKKHLLGELTQEEATDEKNAEFEERVKPLDYWGVGLMVTGGVVGALGLGYLLFSDDDKARQRTAVSPLILPDGTVGFAMAWEF